MKRIAPLLLATAIAGTSAGAAAAQPVYDPQAEAARSRAELQAWDARAEAQRAQAAAAEAQAQLTLRRIEAARPRLRTGPQAWDPDAAVLHGAVEAEAAGRRAADAELQELDARLREMDAFLAPPK